MRKQPLRLRGKPITNGYAEGQAIVSRKPLSFLGGLDVKSGKIVERHHPLEGISISDKILVLYSSKGSTAGVYSFYETTRNKKAPKGMLTCAKDPVIISAAIESEIPAIRLREGDLDKIKSGNYIKMDASKGTVDILR